MNELALAPYFHPTTICFVDDNEAFLDSLDLELPGNWACRTFANPEAALEFLQEPVPLPPLMDRCFSLQRQSGDAIIRLDLSMIEQEINHIDRFRRRSVLVVDYAMPTLDGIRLCQELNDPYIRRAMLTGVADEKLAVEAFNAGLIHRFITKQCVRPLEKVERFVNELVHEYFSQHIERLQTTLAIDPPAFLVDRNVATFVNSLMQRSGLVEYYLVDDPPGLLMLRSSGEIWRLAILDADEMDAQAELARRFAAPAGIQRQLDRRQSIAFLSGLSPEDYFGDEKFPWEDITHKASGLVGENRRWYVSIWKDAPADIDFDPDVSSYDAYLRSL